MVHPTEKIAPKPYALIPFPKDKPKLKKPIGHHRYQPQRHHGTLHLELTVKTALHVSTGAIVMGSDVGQNRIPLIKTMMQGQNNQLLIPGSSFKGVVRSVYEAITNSTLGVVSSKYKRQIPPERLPCRDKNRLCPAARVFGAMDWQGLVQFSDARCKSSSFTPGFMPSLYNPRPDERKQYFKDNKVAGRKFYYHAIKAASPGQQRGIPVQQARKEWVFSTKLHFRNLTTAELGVLLITLGQDSQYPIALKLGAGKPIGMGTMSVEVTQLEQPESIKERYLEYELNSVSVQGSELQTKIAQAIQKAHEELIELPQLQQLQKILAYPTKREAPQGMY